MSDYEDEIPERNRLMRERQLRLAEENKGHPASLHMRPILAGYNTPTIVAVSESTLLVKEGYDEHRIGRVLEGQDDAVLVFSEPLPRENMICWGRARHVTFVDNRTLCAVECTLEGNFFVIIRADDDLFQVNLNRKAYPLIGTGTAHSLEIIDGYGYIVTGRDGPNGHFTLRQLWKFKVPKSTSTQKYIEGIQCGEFESPKGQWLNDGRTNGRIVVGQNYHCDGDPLNGGRQKPIYENVVGNLRSNKFHTIKGSRCNEIYIVDGVVFRWLFHEKNMQLAVCKLEGGGETCKQADYCIKIPLPPVDLDSYGNPGGLNVAKGSGGRFFLKRRRVIMMGYLPGADVPLEDIAMAEAWRNLHPNGQQHLLNANQLSRRHIMLRAMAEEVAKKKWEMKPGKWSYERYDGSIA